MPRLRFRPAALLLIVLVAYAACVQGARAPQVPPRSTLALGDEGEGGGSGSTGPLAIAFASPKGEVTDPSEVTVVFDRPMRPLDLAADEAPPPVKLEPAVPGRWQWVGTSGLQFVPDDHLPAATQYRLEVPGGTRALDGSTLAAPFVLTFSTARPAAVRSDPYEGTRDLRPDSTFRIYFNQPIDDAEVERAVTLHVGDDRRSVPFSVKRPDADSAKAFEIAPKEKLPLDTAVVLEIDEQLRSKEGPLPAGKPKRFAFRTYGPLAVERIHCADDTPKRDCAPFAGLSIELSNPVKLAALKKAVRIEPALQIAWPSWLSDDEPTDHLSIAGKFLPGRTYRVRVAAGIEDVYGQALRKEWSREVRFDDLWPTAQIGVSGTYFEPAARREIPIATVNVAELDLATAPLSEDDVLALEGSDRERLPGWRRIAEMKGGKHTKVRPAAAKNQAARLGVRTEDVLGSKNARGPVAIGIGWKERAGTPEERPTERSAIVQVTDLAISAKVSPHGSLVWVTRLSDGAPVAGASVAIRRPGQAAGAAVVTDANGLALVPAEAFRPTRDGDEDGVVFARKDGDWSYRRVEDALNGWQFGATHDFGDDRPFGIVFTDRGVYRPGDTVRVKAIYRREGHPGTVTPVGETVRVTVEGPSGEEIVKLAPKLGAFGTIAFDVKIPETGKLGSYSILTTVGDSTRGWPDVSGGFEVAEYRPAEFEVHVESDRPSYVRGERAAWIGRGDYLYGAPMAKADARFSVTRSSTWFHPPNLPEGFTTNDEPYWAALPETSEREYEVASRNVRLDERGAAKLEAPLPMPGMRGPETVSCEVEVTDVARQAITGSTTAIVHPASFYVALDPGKDLFVKSGATIAPKVLAVDPKGARVAGVPVAIQLIKRTWTIARQKEGAGLRSVSTPVDTVAASCTVKTTAGAPASCPLAPPGAGYFIVRATAADAKKNPVAASEGVYVLGEGEVGWGDSDALRVELVPDRTSYEVGQTAKLLVKSPFASADALVTVERAGIYTQRRLTLAGAMPTVEIPITADLRPNAFVSVLLVRGRSKAPPAGLEAPDVGAPAFRLGYASLPINPEARRLKVAVTPGKTDYRPGEVVDVGVDVRDRDGKPVRGEVTLYAVDEGVLSLTGYETPDPIGVFGAPRSLRVATLEARSDLAKVRRPLGDLGSDKGLEGGGGGEGSGARRDFRASAFWHAALVTDDAGHVGARFVLPDSLTTYRVMAVVAAEDDRFGFGNERIVASRPLMARPALPRILRAGDRIDAGVVVASKGLPASKVDVELAAEGVNVSGDTNKTIDLPANDSVEVRFAIAAPRVGKAKLRFRVKGGGQRDEVEVTREVLAPISLEAVALYGDTTTASAERLGDLSGIREDVGGLEVSLSSTALVGLDAGMDQLVEYPYGCTEQLTSRLVPLLPLRDLARAYGVEMPPNTDRYVTATVAQILARQRGDGGFGLWEDSPESYPWVSAYALWGLGEAKRRGIAVPASAIEAATRYVRQQLAEEKKSPVAAATSAFILDVLAENGSPDPGRASKLFERRDELPLFGRALLAHAMLLGKGDRASVDELIRDMEGHLRVDGPNARAVVNHGNEYAVLMDSEARTSAMVLRAMVAAQPSHPMAAKLAMGLLADRRGGTWRSTQETAFALLALDAYRKAQERAEPDYVGRVFLGETELFSHAFRGRGLAQPSTTIPAARIAPASGTPLAFEVDGQGRLFYQARLRYARQKMPTQPLDRGFFVKKTLRAVSPETLADALRGQGGAPTTKLSGGDLVLGEVVVVTPSPRNFVVIDDPLPAGLEAVDARLATTSRAYDVGSTYSPGDEDDEHAVAKGKAFRSSWFSRELRDDRVVFFVDYMGAGMYRYRYLARATTHGTFVLPPTRVEEMYTPEVFGRTKADVVEVAPRR